MITIQELDRFWNYWHGSKLLSKGTLKRQVNFLGSIKEYKRSFLKASKQLIEDTNHLNKGEEMVDVAVETVPEGAFVDSLKRTNKSIKAARAEAIGEEAYMVSKRQVEDISIVVKQIKRDLENMLDMSPENSMSLMPGKDFDSKAFFAERLSLTRKLRKANDDLSDMKADHKLLFSEEL